MAKCPHRVKTQVQIPDQLFERAKQVAAERECSFAEVVRRGLEYMTQTNPPDRMPAGEWIFPGPYDLGPFRALPEQWTELAHDDGALGT